MARKRSQQKIGVDCNSGNHKKGAPDQEKTMPKTKGRRKGKVEKTVVEEIQNNYQQRIITSENRDESVQSVSIDSNSGYYVGKIDMVEGSSSKEEDGTPISSHSGPECATNVGRSRKESIIENVLSRLESSDSVKRLRNSVLFMVKTATEFLEKQKPLFNSLTRKTSNAACYILEKVQYAYPIILRWLVQLGKILFLLTVVWLNSALRGVDSFLHMGATAFLSVMWCTVFSTIAMIGMFKFFAALVIITLVGLFIGFGIGVILLAICGIALWWICGSFWTTGLVVCSGGFAFALRHEKLALLIISMYSAYCAKGYAGWLGFLFALNLSFISSDALTYVVRKHVSRDEVPDQFPEQTSGDADASFPQASSFPAADRSPGSPSTSGMDTEMTSDGEVVRLLNCADHYSVLGMSRHGNVDVSILKREYRKKAMLVHPDKNMGNEKSVEAFKKLQNAYEVLLDSVKRKAYDDELRKEELLNIFRGIHNSQGNGRHNLFGSGFARSDGDAEDPFGESKRIACRKCGNFHVWIHTKKTKLTARWCQDCQDFHQAKDGDGWLEQSSQPVLFGMLQKVDPPRAYVCADSKIYDATEWYICQGMRCPANTHKPSFHVNTSTTQTNNNNGKGSRWNTQRGGSFNPPEENMTEEQLFEWLQNAAQAGVFNNFGATSSSESPFARPPGNNSSTTAASSNKRKKKGNKSR